jgi:hypothetical protein
MVEFQGATCCPRESAICADTGAAEGHDFFTPQSVKNADVFLLRYIIHNWPDAKAVTILQHLRDAALPTTQLVIVEKILPLASADQGSEADYIPGAARPMAKAPLLSNWGIATAELYFYDIGVRSKFQLFLIFRFLTVSEYLDPHDAWWRRADLGRVYRLVAQVRVETSAGVSLRPLAVEPPCREAYVILLIDFPVVILRSEIGLFDR